MTYAEKLKDPRWQKKRVKVLERDSFACVLCADDKSTLHVHHSKYKFNPWDADDDDLFTLCERCHELIEKCKSIISHPVAGMDIRNIMGYLSVLPADDREIAAETMLWFANNKDFRSAVHRLLLLMGNSWTKGKQDKALIDTEDHAENIPERTSETTGTGEGEATRTRRRRIQRGAKSSLQERGSFDGQGIIEAKEGT